jgi:carbonic anhydrase
MKKNLKWSEDNLKKDPNYFKKHLNDQKQTFLWIGCSDSRIPAESVLGLQPGELFVHRNIANQVCLADINAMSVIQYAFEVLEVTDIIVAGHYGCGGIHAAFKKEDHGALETWLSHVR